MLLPEIKSKNSLVVLSALLIIAVFIIFYDYIFGTSYLLFKDLGSDSYNSVYPFYKLIIDTIAKDGFPRWSFQQGLGDNVASFNLGNPFNWIIYLLGNDSLPYSIGLVESIKIIVSGVFFYFYLRLLKLNLTTAILGGLVYGLSGYLSLTAGWVVFISYWAFLFAFWLYSLEMLLQGKWHFLPIAVFLTAIDQPFNLFIFGEVTLLYLYIWFSIHNTSFKNKTFYLFELFSKGMIGLLLGCILLVGNLLAIINSPRGSGGVSYFDKLINIPFFEPVKSLEIGTIVSRFFGNNLFGVCSTYIGAENYFEAPALYIGLFVLLLFPQIFIFVHKALRKKLFISLGIILIILFFPFFRYAFWGFTGSYYRILGLFIAVSLLIPSLVVINKIGNGHKLNLILLIATYLFWIILLFGQFSANEAIAFVPFEKFKALFVLTLILGLVLMYNYNTQPKYLYLILLVSFFDALEVAHTTLNKRNNVSVEEWKKKAGYNDDTIGAIKYIRQIDSGFYRIEKDFSSGLAIHASFNDPMAQGYNGTTVYNSFNNKNQTAYMIGLGIINPNDENQSRWLYGLRDRPIALGNLAVKYTISKNAIKYADFGYELIKTIGPFTIYKNPNALPLGCTFNKYMPESDFNKLTSIQKDFALYQSIVISEEDSHKLDSFERNSNPDTNMNYNQLKIYADKLKTESLNISDFSNNHFNGSVTISEPKLMYFSIPFDNGWHFKANDIEVKKLKANFGMTAIMLQKGNYNIKAEYRIPYLKWTGLATILGFLLYIGLIIKSKRSSKLPA